MPGVRPAQRRALRDLGRAVGAGAPQAEEARGLTRPSRPSPVLVARLRSAGCVFAEEESLLLEREAPDEGRLAEWAARRCAGEPLEHLLGWAELAGRRVLVAPGVFVPRRRTELLVREAVAELRRLRRPSVVVDACCGSGAVGAVVAGTVDDVELHASDRDAAAVACARLNLAGTSGATHLGDLLEPLPAALRGRVDLVLANAPYVPSAEIRLMPPEARVHEPRHAHDGGADGLDLHRRLAADAPGWLATGGLLMLETSIGQVDGTAEAMRGHGFVTRVVRDDDVDGTVVVGRLPG